MSIAPSTSARTTSAARTATLAVAGAALVTIAVWGSPRRSPA